MKYERAGSAAGGESPEGEGPLEAHAAPGAEGKWGHALSRRGGSAHKAHLPPRISVSTRPGGLNIPEAMPSNAQLSPVGDIGEWKQKEALAAFPALKKMTDHIKRASHKIPAPKDWVK